MPVIVYAKHLGVLFLRQNFHTICTKSNLRFLSLRNLSTLKYAAGTRRPFSILKDSVYCPSYNPPSHKDTIFALSTSPGKAGIAVIRISGPSAFQALKRMTHGSRKFFSPQKALFTQIKHPFTQEILDHGITLWFPAPRSFTGEDTVEFHVHGGNAVVKAVLDAIGSLEGFRTAERGEFSRRAFGNNKMDLTEIEGMADLLNAETEAQRKQALRQAEGGLKHFYENWRKNLLLSMALVEAIIDFGEDENIEEGVWKNVNSKVSNLHTEIAAYLAAPPLAETLRNGIHITLFGPPNAGKSSFLNSLAQREAAIVSPIPGTTRDVVEINLNIGGWPVIVSDTAGLRKADEYVEQEGVKKAKRKIESADINICILSLPDLLIPTIKPVDPFITASISPETLLILNKEDLVPPIMASSKAILHSIIAMDEKFTSIRNILATNRVWTISCETGTGLNAFIADLVQIIATKYEITQTATPQITNSRHRKHLQDCNSALQTFLSFAEEDIVLAAEELRQAINALGRITGRVDVEDVLDILFVEFCIGK